MFSHGDDVVSDEVENDMSSEVESAPASVDATKSYVLLPFITKKIVFKSKKVFSSFKLLSFSLHLQKFLHYASAS